MASDETYVLNQLYFVNRANLRPDHKQPRKYLCIQSPPSPDEKKKFTAVQSIGCECIMSMFYIDPHKTLQLNYLF